MAVVSALGYDVALLPPLRTLRPAEAADLGVIGVFLVVALLACARSAVAHRAAVETEARDEAEPAADPGRPLLRAPSPGAALPAVGNSGGDAEPGESVSQSERGPPGRRGR